MLCDFDEPDFSDENGFWNTNQEDVQNIQDNVYFLANDMESEINQNAACDLMIATSLRGIFLMKSSLIEIFNLMNNNRI